ncbi:peptidase inhibitor family I36 protein [Lentzea sp. NBRC 105346]|uniref:peptidase inhibitor family I36 protein n=1 Tax=Lentzea sp. NBRC 105346 TaxID=3032205 RepID=UPI002556DD7F|nr:peptidase inhibitor family I36 protein [Lentzea sp. NBRC 105346]
MLSVFAARSGPVVLAHAVGRPQALGILAVVGMLIAGYFVITDPAGTAKWVRTIFATESSGMSAAETSTTTTESTAEPLPPPVESAPAPAEMIAWDCPVGSVCFWNDADGTGSRCEWDIADPDWLDGEFMCSWADRDNVMSVLNNSAPGESRSTLVFFAESGYQQPIACEVPGQRINLKGTYRVRSHKWTSGGCR